LERGNKAKTREDLAMKRKKRGLQKKEKTMQKGGQKEMELQRKNRGAKDFSS